MDTLCAHWIIGLTDIRRSFVHPEWFDIAARKIGSVTHDVLCHLEEVDDTSCPVKLCTLQMERISQVQNVAC